MPLTSRSNVSSSINQMIPAQEVRDNLGRLRVSSHQNIYDADFEYGAQPMRWENFTAGAGTIVAQPGQGGVRMRVTTASGDITIRQSRPYHRYQPGKTMSMTTAINFGTAQTNQLQRVGMFDDSNGVFFEQGNPSAATGNPYGMSVVVRSDSGGTVTDTRVALPNWNGNQAVRDAIDWTRIQMVWVEYAWYGAGMTRFGIFLEGTAYVLHDTGWGNLPAQTRPWARTGNLPARYEQRNTGTVAAQNDMFHYGISVVVDGRIDEQRGFTYSYGQAVATPQRTVTSGVKFPILSFRGRVMGTQEYTQATSASTGGTTSTLVSSAAVWTTNQWQGRFLYLPAAPLPVVTVGTSAATNVGTVTFTSAHNLSVGQTVTLAGFTPAGWNGTWPVLAVTSSTIVTVQLGTNPGSVTVFGTATTPITSRITSNTSTTLTCVDFVTGGTTPFPIALTAGLTYTIGIINRGQILPQQLYILSSAACVVEIYASTSTSPVVLTGGSFVSMVSLGAANSFAERDATATAMAGGELVFAFLSPINQLQIIDLSSFFPLFTNIRGNNTDVFTIAVTGTANVGAYVVSQEAMS